MARTFRVELVKPSHYDDDGYVIQWRRSAIPSNSLACLYALARDVAARRALGPDVEVVIEAADETHTVIDPEAIARRIRAAGAGVVFLTGVQTNQFPRAADLARQFRAAGIQVAIGGFHVSGCQSMLPELPAEARELQALGVSLFAGEAEGRLEAVLRDALAGSMKPLYDFMDDLPALGGTITPFLPRSVARRYMAHLTSFDAGRGCPFKCSFCTIINVQGRTSRWREADDVERIVRENLAQGIRRFFVTDDNFARNRNWEPIFDRLAALRKSGIPISLTLQVDTMCHKLPGFIEKARQAGTRSVFIGLENINPDNLTAALKFQNRIGEYRAMFQEWRKQKILTYAGYILGFPNDTPDSIARDIEIIKRELPVDVLEFFVLTPLPGSADHQALHRQGTWMDPDMNKYDLEHVTTRHHPRMTPEVLAEVYDRSWHQYYTPEHIETLMRRAEVMGPKAGRIALHVFEFYGSYRYEKLHPLQSGLFRRKRRTSRRAGLPLESPLVFYPREAARFFSKYFRLWCYFLRLHFIRRKVERDPKRLEYTDLALAPPSKESDAALEMMLQAPTRAAPPRHAAAAGS
jgi:radical SAM superfamily enzyme YgiQ (UPF0313 family)